MRVRQLAFALSALLLVGLLSAIILPSDAAPEQPAPSAPAISAASEFAPLRPAATAPTINLPSTSVPEQPPATAPTNNLLSLSTSTSAPEQPPAIRVEAEAEPPAPQAVTATTAPATATSATTPPPCENGTAVPSPADNPGLVADCTVLLAAEATLAGTATLNWSADRAITAWTGVTVASVPYGAPERVTTLDLQSGSLNGSIPAALGDLSALRELRLQWNQLTGSIPAALGDLTQLTYLGLGGNQLSGAIPPALGAIGSTLTTLHLTGPSPLPSGIGLTGAIPPALGNLTGLQHLWLDGNALTGPIPTRLRWLTDLRGLNLNKNQLTGAIPTQLGALTKLRELRLENNQLAGAIPTQLADLRSLRKAYLKNNSGLSGCVPRGLGDVRFNDAARLNLPTCPAGTPPTPATPLPTYALTITATGGGSVNPGGTTRYDEDSAVTLRASWNDATHSFTAWGGACSGGATSCELTMDADKTVTATFAALPADRCATTAAADCIRAVYKGAPGDYAQVQDIPADHLITPGSDGRYQVERGQQITVVTAAPLPTGYTRFYLQRRTLVRPSPTSYERLIPPVGTTYTFTPNPFEGAASLITFDLTAARPRPLPRPGLKPELGDVVVTTTFQVITPAPAATPTEVPDSSLNGEAFRPGTYAFSLGQSGFPPLIVDIPTSEHQIKWRWAGISAGGVFICLADIAEESILCLNLADGQETVRHVADTTGDATSVRIADVFDYIAASARLGPVSQ